MLDDLGLLPGIEGCSIAAARRRDPGDEPACGPRFRGARSRTANDYLPCGARGLDERHQTRAIDAGASGYVLKDNGRPEVGGLGDHVDIVFAVR
jgi:hypothetical protein